MQTGRVIRISMTKLPGDQFIPFQVDYVSLELFRNHQIVGNLTRKSPLSGAQHRRGDVLAHYLNCIGRCHDPDVCESLKESANSEPMVSMAVSEFLFLDAIQAANALVCLIVIKASTNTASLAHI